MPRPPPRRGRYPVEGTIILTSAPVLTATPSGDTLELRPGGSWTAVNAAALERLSGEVTPQLDQRSQRQGRLTDLRELDTLGAWMLEKMSRRVTSAGHRADVVGVADNYAGLIEEVRQVNRHNPAPVRPLNPVVAKLNDVGRSAIERDGRCQRCFCRCWARCSWP